MPVDPCLVGLTDLLIIEPDSEMCMPTTIIADVRHVLMRKLQTQPTVCSH
jgi:hypothetical protein